MPVWSIWRLQAEDSFPCGQRACLCSQSISNRSMPVAAPDLGLPGWVHARRTDQVDPVVQAAAHQELGIDVGSIDQVLARWQAFGRQSLVDRGRALCLMHRGQGCHHVREEMDRVVLTGLAQVHDPNAIDAIGFTMSVAFVWPAIAKPRRRRSRPS